MQADWRFKTAGFCAWLAIAAPASTDIYAGRLAGGAAMAWGVAFIVFGAAYALYLRPATTPGTHRVKSLTTVAILTAAAMTMIVTSAGLMKYLASVSLTIVAAELPYLLPPRQVWTWVALQSAALTAVFWLSFGWVSGMAGGLAYAGFQVLALGRTWLELRERQARQALAAANAELRGTQALLAESSRTAERLRISRDLHDSMGHHLTALSLQLDLLGRQLEAPAADRVREAHAITRLLLADVRNVVGELRSNAAIDLRAAMIALAAPNSEPRVHVEVPDRLAVDSPEHANTLLRCAQEMVTNAVRHSRARNIALLITDHSSGIALEGSDDGIGAAELVPGHGLNGMRERLESQGGSLAVSTGPGRGVRLRAFVPHRPER